MCQRSLSQTRLGTAGCVRGAGSSPAHPGWTGRAEVINSICPRPPPHPRCLGQKRDDLHLSGKLGHNQFGARFFFTGNLGTDGERPREPAGGLAEASIPVVQALCFSFLPSSMFPVCFSACGCWPTAWPGSFQERSHRRGLDGPC